MLSADASQTVHCIAGYCTPVPSYSAVCLEGFFSVIQVSLSESQYNTFMHSVEAMSYYTCVLTCSAFTADVGWVIRPVKTVGRITYIVLVQTLNHAQSIHS